MAATFFSIYHIVLNKCLKEFNGFQIFSVGQFPTFLMTTYVPKDKTILKATTHV